MLAVLWSKVLLALVLELWPNKAYDVILSERMNDFFQFFGLTRQLSSDCLALDNKKTSTDCCIAAR